MRWQPADDGEPALFAVEDVVGPERSTGRLSDLEFLPVVAKRVLNRVPGRSRMAFRWTINVYRGCSHACTYCLAGDTPILTADGRNRPLADIRPGDVVYGTERVGNHRRYVPSTVLAHWRTLKPAYRITLADGTGLVASADHRFLTERGWKHVTDAPGQRPHLTTDDALLGVGHLSPAPKRTDSYNRGYVCGMIRGDADLGHCHYTRQGRTTADVWRFRLALCDPEPLRRTAEILTDCGITLTEFDFGHPAPHRRPMRAVRSSKRSDIETIRELVAWPVEPDLNWSRGFLAGLSERLRFFALTDVATTRKRTIDDVAIKSAVDLRVVSVEELGITIPMFDITTTTGDFIADGVVSHNCFARPTHEYLGLNAGEDFDRRIVVKVNAVEKLRAELADPAWLGDPVAMGTNTDPYQRAEGKYRLTRGVLQALAERHNPFSILTKSALVLRDLDVLQQAAEHADVAVNFSVGTLDERVWRATEPGTPHPRRRIEAIRTLAEAGIRTGALIAPVLPGLSDSPEQLREVAGAIRDAGGAVLGVSPLYLRPGTREVFLSWLAGFDPALHADYLRRYAGTAYAPRHYAERLHRLIEHTPHGILDGGHLSPGSEPGR